MRATYHKLHPLPRKKEKLREALDHGAFRDHKVVFLCTQGAVCDIKITTRHVELYVVSINELEPSSFCMAIHGLFRKSAREVQNRRSKKLLLGESMYMVQKDIPLNGTFLENSYFGKSICTASLEDVQRIVGDDFCAGIHNFQPDICDPTS